MYAGINISGINAEVMPGQWEFQVGPCFGIDCGDQLWLARYILERVGEDFGVCVSFDSKPIKDDWNGNESHIKFSTKSMRSNLKINNKTRDYYATNNRSNKKSIGMEAIMDAIKKLAINHSKHMLLYGKLNENTNTNKNESLTKINKFSYGIGNRNASIRIPYECEKNGCGYLEDRRPSANCDPYDVTSIIAHTILS